MRARDTKPMQDVKNGYRRLACAILINALRELSGAENGDGDSIFAWFQSTQARTLLLGLDLENIDLDPILAGVQAGTIPTSRIGLIQNDRI